MTDAGSAIVSLDDLPWTLHHGDTAWASLTGALGATETRVDAVRVGDGDGVELAGGPERLLVPLDGSVVGDGFEGPVSRPGVARVPAGVGDTLRADGPATVVLVAAPAEPAQDASPTVVDLERAAFVDPGTSDVATAFLTAPLGCTGMKVNARRLEPGQAVPDHTEGTQEELFVPVGGPAGLRVDGATQAMALGSVARVAPAVPRAAVNHGDADAVWVMVGAPPTGGPADWDPGAEIIE